MSRSRTSPSADRTIEILNFLGAHPDGTFSFSDLRRRLGMSSGTIHALLASLVGAGYVRRSATDLCYSLGPALLALGAAARQGYRVVDDLVPEMEQLSAELGVTCHASVAEGDEMVVMARTGPEEPFGFRLRIGDRIPIIPPLGTAYMAWSDQPTIDSYLSRAGTNSKSKEMTGVRAALASVRKRGYSIALDPATRRSVGEVMDGQSPESDRRNRLGPLLAQMAKEEYVLLDLQPGSTYDVVAITAPVFGPDRAVLAVLGMGNFRHPIDAAVLPKIAGRLCAATGLVSDRIARP